MAARASIRRRQVRSQVSADGWSDDALDTSAHQRTAQTDMNRPEFQLGIQPPAWSSPNDMVLVPTNVKIGLDAASASTSKLDVQEKRTDTLAIVLGIVFGLIFLLVVCLIAFLCIRRRKKHGSFIYQDNVSVASVDTCVAAAPPDLSSSQKETSTASSSPERAATQPATALETISEKGSARASPAVVQGRTSPVNAMGITMQNGSPAAKNETFPPYYPPLPAPHQLSAPSRRHDSDLAYVPNDPFYDSNIAIYDLQMQQHGQQHSQPPHHMRNRSRGSLQGNPPMILAPLREYPEHNGFREPRNPRPQDPREQALYNYRNTPELLPQRTLSGHRRPRNGSMPTTPDQLRRSNSDASYRPSPDTRMYRYSPDMHRPSPDVSSYRPSPEMVSYRASPDHVYRRSPDMHTPRRSFDSIHRNPELAPYSRGSPRAGLLHHPMPKPVALQHNPNWPWPQNHPAGMGPPPTSHPIQATTTSPYSHHRAPNPGTHPAMLNSNLTAAARYRTEMLRYKQRQSHRRWTSEPHLLASNPLRQQHQHNAAMATTAAAAAAAVQRKPVPLPPRTTGIPPLEQVKLPAFWWEEQRMEDIAQSVEELLLVRQMGGTPVKRRFSFESRPVFE